MTKIQRTLFLTVAACAAMTTGACASLAPYGPQGGPGGQGYSEQRIERDRFRVSYNGVGAPGPVADMALLRAADLTIEQGFDWFAVTQRYIDGRPDSAGGFRPSVSVGVGSSSGRYGGYRYSGTSTGIGVGLNFQGPSPTSTVLEVRLGRGARPDDVEAYDAREVRYSLSGRE